MRVGRSYRGSPQPTRNAALDEARRICGAIEGIGFTAERSSSGLGGFMTIAPCGLKYLPPCATLDEAREEIRDRSLYEGEPGWKILELDESGEPIGAAVDAIDAFRRMDGAQDSSREVK